MLFFFFFRKFRVFFFFRFRPHEYIYGKYGANTLLAHMYACPPYLEHPFTSVHRIKLIRRMIESTVGDG